MKKTDYKLIVISILVVIIITLLIWIATESVARSDELIERIDHKIELAESGK